MAVKKKTTRRKKKVNLLTGVASLPEESYVDPEITIPPVGKKRSFWKIALVVIVVAAVAAFIFRRNPSLVVVATVNGTPITRWTLTQRLTDRFGSQMLEAIVGEQLILSEARKQNTDVSEQEINSKIAEIEGSFKGSLTLEESLKLQGLTKTEFMNQIRLQLLIDKMLAREVSVSAAEVDEFLKTNLTQLRATGEAERRIEAEKEVRDNKVSEKFVEWFGKLKETAKVNRYL